MTKQIKMDDMVNGLLEQVGTLSKENVLLRIQLELALREEVEEDGNEPVPAGNGNE